jgi:multiple sugar transport system permease protein
MQATARMAPQRRKGPIWSPEAPWIWLAPAVIVLLIYSIYPLVFNVYISFRAFDPVGKDFDWVGLGNWIDLLHDLRALNSLRVTLIYGVSALTIELILGMGIALIFDTGIYVRGLWQTLIILPMVTPPAVAGLIFRLLEHANFGVVSWVLYNLGILHPEEPLLGGTGQFALVGVILPDIWQWTPFCALILLAGLKSLPTEPLEAAEVDGANAWQKFWWVKFPLLRGVLAIVVLFRIIDLYRLFDYIYIMTSGGPGQRTETLSFYTYQTYSFIAWGRTATLGVAILVLIWVTTNLYIRFIKVEW